MVPCHPEHHKPRRVLWSRGQLLAVTSTQRDYLPAGGYVVGGETIHLAIALRRVGWFVHPGVTLRNGRASRAGATRAPHRIWVWGENAWGRLTWTSLVLTWAALARTGGTRRMVRSRRRAGRTVRYRMRPGRPPQMRRPDRSRRPTTLAGRRRSWPGRPAVSRSWCCWPWAAPTPCTGT